MQTFLPYADFDECARVLDRQRLGKQRVEAYQILRTLTGLSQGWRNHPAVRMWAGHARALVRYGLAVCREWRRRGYRDQMGERLAAMLPHIAGTHDDPPWLGDERLHSSHRAALLAKAPEHYGQFGWAETPGIDYYWPEVAK